MPAVKNAAQQVVQHQVGRFRIEPVSQLAVVGGLLKTFFGALDSLARHLGHQPGRVDVVKKLAAMQQNGMNAPVARLAEPLQRLQARSEEHTSELQSRGHLVCRLLLEKKKKKTT